jgi:hypothetical protein
LTDIVNSLSDTRFFVSGMGGHRPLKRTPQIIILNAIDLGAYLYFTRRTLKPTCSRDGRGIRNM